MPLTPQEKLIGKHPDSNGFFSDWLNPTDIPATTTLRQRELNPDPSKRQEAIEKIADLLICHHLHKGKEKELAAKKRILSKYDYEAYFHTQSILPKTDTTQKGNCAEIILAEYLVCTSGLDLLVYKLHYNPNVDQSMKGDDVLLLKKHKIEQKIIVGESKFQKTPNKSVVEKITNVMGTKTVLPISLPFVEHRLREKGKKRLARKLANLQAKLPLGKTDVVNVGFVMSNHNTHKNVTSHGNTKNNKLAFVSLAIDNPEDFIRACYKKALHKLEDIKECPIHKFPVSYSGELANAKIKKIVESLKLIISF